MKKSASFEALKGTMDASNRKHSSGDLHSRLKTRKLLGVGETDDGDVHRSKLSQILGHSEQLYIRLPRGLRLWQFLCALMFTVIALWALMFPRSLFSFALEQEIGTAEFLPIRLYGAALLSFAVVFWNTLRSQDKDVIRWGLLASIIYFTIQAIVCAFCSSLPVFFTRRGSVYMLATCALPFLSSIWFYVTMGRHHYHSVKETRAK